MEPKRQLDDWLLAYREYTKESESPANFHMWVALGTIAGAAQRKILMSTAYFDVHTNMYIILVSPPGVCKKTTALRIGKNFLKMVEPKVNFATESSSAGALIQMMSKISNPAHQSMTLFSSELGTLLGVDPVNMVDFLTDVYDGNPDWNKQTLSRGNEKIERPWLNLMAGTTPQWLGDNLSSTAVEGGLAARSLYPYSDELILKSPFPEDSPELVDLRKKLAQDLSVIATLDGLFRFAPDARKWYEEWYMDKSRFPKLMDGRTAGYFTRKPIHLLKAAMAFSLSYKSELVLRLDDLQRALAALDSTEPGMRKAFSAVGKNEYATDLERVKSQIISKGRITYGELLAENYHNLGKLKLDNILAELAHLGIVADRTNGKMVYMPEPPKSVTAT